MADVEKYEVLVLGSGEAGKWTAWTMADEGHRTAMVERKWLGGSCPNIACLPSKNVIYSARIASLARRGAEFGLEMDRLRINMAGVQQRTQVLVILCRLLATKDGVRFVDDQRRRMISID